MDKKRYLRFSPLVKRDNLARQDIKTSSIANGPIIEREEKRYQLVNIHWPQGTFDISLVKENLQKEKKSKLFLLGTPPNVNSLSDQNTVFITGFIEFNRIITEWKCVGEIKKNNSFFDLSK